MRTLEQALSDHELITLRVIGEWCDLDLTGYDKTACVKKLAKILAQIDLPNELDYLSLEESNGLRDLVDGGGRLAVGIFSRKHGQVRLMGPGRLEREEPWLDPESPAEALWYRGFLYRGFDEGGDGLVEYYYLPDELHRQFRPAAQPKTVSVPAGTTFQPASAPLTYAPALTDAVDDLTTILAFAQRDGLQEGQLPALAPYLLNNNPDRASLLVTLGWEMGMFREAEDGIRPTRAAVNWLQKERDSQLNELLEAWSKSGWNELGHTPGLTFDGTELPNDPITLRATLFDHWPRDDKWLAVEQLVGHIKENDPDFQRPDGNYDSWYIREAGNSQYITGFANWGRVEGRVLQFLVQGPMIWLGLVENGEGVYRLAQRTLDWLAGKAPAGTDVRVPMVVQADATLLVPHNTDRYQRFQVARFADPQPLTAGKPYLYLITPSSLKRAKEQGINPERVIQFLATASGRAIPASTKRGIERWAEQGVEGRLEKVVILRVKDKDILDKLQANPKTRPFIGERLGDLAAVISLENWQELQRASAQLGLLLDS